MRSLPHVIACSVAGEAITVLIDLTGDPAETEAAVAGAARSFGHPGEIRVLGGVGQVAGRWVAPRRVAAAGIFAAALAGAATLLTSVFGPARSIPAIDAAFDPHIERSGRHADARSLLGGGPGAERLGSSAPQGEGDADGLMVAIRALVSGPAALPSSHLRVEPVEPVVSASDPASVPLRPRRVRAAEAQSCTEPPERSAPRLRRGIHRGNGPRPWSRSILVPPKDC